MNLEEAVDLIYGGERPVALIYAGEVVWAAPAEELEAE